MLVLVHLGTSSALSLAELRAVVPDLRPLLFGPNWLTAEFAMLPKIDRLGGTVRFVEITSDPQPESALRVALLALLLGAGQEGRLEFGLSILNGELPLQKMGLELKTMLKQRGIAARFASSGERQLASVVVKKNRVVELVLAQHAGQWLVGRTVAIQDIESYVFRDTHKPARNLSRGMLPPKIAQILLNLVNPPAGTVTIDPFCGTGTVLLEGIVQGRAVRGSDIDPIAVDESQRNLKWFGMITQHAYDPAWVQQADAGAFPYGKDLGGIATEGTLGRMLSVEPDAKMAERVFREIAAIHRPFFARAAEALPAGRRIALTLPAYRTAKGTLTFPGNAFRDILPKGLALTPLLPPQLADHYMPRLTEKGGLVVERPDQFVGREVIVLTRV